MPKKRSPQAPGRGDQIKIRKILSKIRRVFIELFYQRSEVELYDASAWDRQYATGTWGYLRNNQQMVRYAIIEAWRLCFSPRGSVLDLGCGEGILLRSIPHEAGINYTGVDLSGTAIKLASMHIRHPEKESFIQGDLNCFIPPNETKFDLIIFNEVLYYCGDIERSIMRYRKFLNPRGLFIASVNHPKRKTWEKVNRLLQDVCIQTISVTTFQPRKGWNLGIYRP